MFAAAERNEDVLHEVIGGSKTLNEEFDAGSDIDILLLQVKLQEVIGGNLTRKGEFVQNSGAELLFCVSVLDLESAC